MGYELWKSPKTGYRRKGTRMSDLRDLFETGITANSIQEPLQCCFYRAPSIEAREELSCLDFDVAGLKNAEEDPVKEYVNTVDLQDGNCEEAAIPIVSTDIISESTPLIDLLVGLKDRTFYFVLNGKEISGIITRADLQKPPARILLFGIISLLEMHLTFLVRKYYTAEKWRDKLQPARIKGAERIMQLRKDRNEEIDLTDCLQFTDKRELVVASSEIREHLGLDSEEIAEKLLKSLEEIRDKLAHSQDVVTGTTWEELVDVLLEAEQMLQRSDDKVDGN